MTGIDRRAFLAASAAATVLPVGARAQTPGWTAKADLPWPVQEIYAASHAGKIWTAGGLMSRTGEPLHIEDRTATYDPDADRWEEGPGLPAPRHHPMLISGDADLYVIGGYARSDAGDWANTTNCWVLDNGTWVETIPLETPQAEAVGVRHNGDLHLIGGRTPGGSNNAQWADQADTDLHRVYITGADVWDEARPLPMARNSAAAAVLDGAIWVAGGRTVSGGGTGRLDRYTPSEDRWDTLAPIPRSHAANNQVGGGLAMAALGGKLAVFGGEWFRPRAEGGGGGVFAETWIYDPARDVWEAGPDMRTPRHGLAAVATENAVYAIGGGAVVSGGRATGIVEALSL